jgi:NAD(P)-dependent dehydrogenase (short-subunit alcohol dehydrogenase family)
VAAPGDLGEVAGCRRVVEGAAAALGGLDVLVNNAGVGGPQKPIGEITAEEWDAGIGPLARCRAQTPPPAPRPQGAGEW